MWYAHAYQWSHHDLNLEIDTSSLFIFDSKVSMRLLLLSFSLILLCFVLLPQEFYLICLGIRKTILQLVSVSLVLFVCLQIANLVYFSQMYWSWRSVASLLSATDCVSPVQRRWPEDIAWHPHGDSIVCAYSADGGDHQISVVGLNESHGVSFKI